MFYHQAFNTNWKCLGFCIQWVVGGLVPRRRYEEDKALARGREPLVRLRKGHCPLVTSGDNAGKALKQYGRAERRT